MPLILLRHTRPAGGEGRCYGRTDLAPGPDLAAAAAAIEAALPALAAIATSPARRCTALAALIGGARGLAPVEDPRLAEIDFGTWEGSLWDEVPRAELDAWAADLQGARPHGGESVAMLTRRVAEALADWRGRAGHGTVLLVGHAGVARAARALAGEPGAWTSRLGHGEWIEV